MAKKDWEALRREHKAKFNKGRSKDLSTARGGLEKEKRKPLFDKEEPASRPLSSQQPQDPAKESKEASVPREQGIEELSKLKKGSKGEPGGRAREAERPIGGPAGHPATASPVFGEPAASSDAAVSGREQQGQAQRPEIKEETGRPAAALQKAGRKMESGSDQHQKIDQEQASSGRFTESKLDQASNPSENRQKRDVPARPSTSQKEKTTSEKQQPLDQSSPRREKEQNEQLLKEWKEKSAADSTSGGSFAGFFVFLAIAAIIIAMANQTLTSSDDHSGLNDSYRTDGFSRPISEERRFTSQMDSRWILAEGAAPAEITYEQAASLVMGDDYKYTKPTIDQVVAALGKAQSGKETKMDGKAFIQSLSYSWPENYSSLSLTFSSYASAGSLGLVSLSLNNPKSGSLPDRNQSLTAVDFADIQPGKDYQEIISQLGVPSGFYWSNLLRENSLDIYYKLADEKRVTLKIKKGSASSYQLEEITGLEEETAQTSEASS